MSMAGRQKTQSSTSWRPVINGTRANVILEKHTIQYNIQKTYKQRESKRHNTTQNSNKLSVNVIH